MTESTTPLTSEEMSVSADKASSEKSTSKKALPKKGDEQKLSADGATSKVSKLAIFAVLIAIAAPSGHYYWQQLQDQQLTKTLTSNVNKDTTATLSRYQNQLQQALTKQQQSFNQQLQQAIAKIQTASHDKIIELDSNIARLEQEIKQRQPSDWLLHEAEYLIRIAARTLWLEHDTTAAIGLLNDADNRLAELKDPAFLPVREIIHQDIKSLELLPQLQTEEVVLSLMAMNKQVSLLTLAMTDLGLESDKKADLALTDDINDWQANLSKTWQKFLNDFIRIRPRTGSVEPLMSPVQQESLKQNLSLKIQLTLWAATERKGDVYQQSLTDIQQWLTDYFDMSNTINQHFAKALTRLKEKQVSYDYPSDLASLTAIRSTLINKPSKLPASPLKDTNSFDDSAQKTNVEQVVKKATDIVKPIKEPVQQTDKSKDEGSI